MSKAKGQHFLPRFLLAGFASRVEGDQAYTYQFRRGSPPFEANIRDVAKQRFFHGDPTVSDLEAKVASEESRFALLLQGIRPGVDPNPLAVAEFIAHLIARTKSLRDGLASATHSLWDAIRDHRNSKRFRERLEKEALREARKHLTPAHQRLFDKLPRRRKLLLVRSFMQSPEAVSALNQAFEVFDGLRPRIPTMVAEAHNKALERTPFRSTARVAFLATLHWYVLGFLPNALILGDVGVVGRDSESDQLLHPLARPMGDLRYLALPISHSQLLVGAQGSPMPPEPEQLNRETAELSRDFFVASQATEREMQYSHLLGNRSEYVGPDEIRNVLRRD